MSVLRWSLVWCFLCASFLGHADSVNENASLKLYMSEYPPFCYTEAGEAKGLAVDAVRSIMNDLNLESPILSVPWKRGLRYLEGDTSSALFTITRTAEREDRYKWVGPISLARLVLFAKHDADIVINSLDDARKVRRIGTVQGYSAEKYLKQKGFTNLVSNPGDQKSNPVNLLRGFLDLWMAVDVVGTYTAELQGINPNELKVVYVVRDQPKYIAFSRSTPDEIVRRWQNALDGMVDDGRLAKITEKWLTTRTASR
ncbi:MAG: transporter substrate-binding domain-containing protein [Pseudomonadales bacterium]|nr:transporter substrate-binding domain-containing protein [Pseudomonadales bacterium]